MITSIESYVQAVSNVPALLQNKDFLETLHPRYTELLARCNNQPGASPPPTTPIDGAIQNLLLTGTLPDGGQPNKHSIGVAGLLCAKTKTQEFSTNFESFLVQFSSFMDVADWGHLRIVAGVVTEICSMIADQMIRRNQPILGINLLGNVATRLQAHDKMLTCVHASVLQLCCASYNFKAAIKFIVDDFEEFTADLKSSDNTHYLLSYLYYSGLVHTALKQYNSAIYFFEACIRVPAITLSHIMLEAYKKYVLVCLAHLGEVPIPHKTATQVVNRLLKPNALPYTELGSAFNVGAESLSNCVAKHLDTFRRDQNYGLVKQVRVAHMRMLIRKLTRTFLTLSLEDVGRRAGCDADQPENVVLSMIQDEVIYAKVNQRDGMVRFLDGAGGTKGGSIDVLAEKITACVELNKRIGIMNERISTNPEFISKVVLTIDSTGVQDHDASSAQQISSSSVVSASGKFGTSGARSGSSSSAGNSNVGGSGGPAFNL